jgi:hypothetical protein
MRRTKKCCGFVLGAEFELIKEAFSTPHYQTATRLIIPHIGRLFSKAPQLL